MFFSVARPRRVLSALLLLLLPLVKAKEDTLFTSSVTYCEPPETLLIQQFDIAYFAKNSSIFFNVSVASVQPNVNVSANIQVNVYGMHSFNFTVDLCNLLGGALCPLPMYNFTGVDSIALPSSLDISHKIPGVAYKIPDLEAFAQLTLIETKTGIVKACVQATLSNGWSTRQIGVEWATRGLALLALASALWQSLSPDALAPYRLLDLMYLYQSIVTTGLLNLNYPSVYRGYTLNFSWAMGLFPSSATSSVQRSINNMRHLTGGSMADSNGGSAVGLVNRKLSPYNQPQPNMATAIRAVANLPRNFVAALSNLSTRTALFSRGVATVTSVSDNVLEAGVPIYTNTIGIATANAFMTMFFSALILAAVALGVLALGYGAVVVMSRMTGRKGEKSAELKYLFPAFARAWGLRLCLIAFPPIIIFTFYQWSLKDSWLSILLSVILLIAVAGYILYVVFLTLRFARRDTPYSLYTNPSHLASHGPLYAQYRTPRFYFTIILIVATFLKAIFVAAAKDNGEVQVILMIVVEFGVLASYLVLRPHKTRGGDVIGTYLAIVRFVCTAVMIAFMENLAVAAIPRVAIGAVSAVIFSIAVIVLFINIVLHSPGVNRLLSKSSRRSQQDSAAESIMEKGDESPSFTESEAHLGRPRNPTPETNVLLDPDVNQPYPTITPTHTTAEPPSPATTDMTNLGSLLPRRWSFQQSHSRPPSQSTSPHSPAFSSTPSTPRSPSASHGHSRQPTVDENSTSLRHAL